MKFGLFVFGAIALLCDDVHAIRGQQRQNKISDYDEPHQQKHVRQLKKNGGGGGGDMGTDLPDGGDGGGQSSGICPHYNAVVVESCSECRQPVPVCGVTTTGQPCCMYSSKYQPNNAKEIIEIQNGDVDIQIIEEQKDSDGDATTPMTIKIIEQP